jgi:hypothetical protein
MVMTNADFRMPLPPVIGPYSGSSWDVPFAAYPTSGTWSGGNITLAPLRCEYPFTVAKAYWANGSTVGTDSIDIGAYRLTNPATMRMDLIRSTGLTLSAGANVVQEVGTWRIAPANLTASNDSTDSTTYTTASVTLKAGRLYLMSFTNTAASAAAASGIAGGGSMKCRATTQYNTTAHRVSLWSCVPTSDYTGTIVITFGATQTGCKWSLNEFHGVDTATNDGIVQTATATGNGTTPQATLAAFASANNATFAALANTADNTTTPKAGFNELSDDATAVTPAQFLETEFIVSNDTTPNGTITSGQWGAIGAELKADTTTPFVIPPTLVGQPNTIYLAFLVSGSTATVYRDSGTAQIAHWRGLLLGQVSTATPLPSTLTAAANASPLTPLAGFSRRSLIG